MISLIEKRLMSLNKYILEVRPSEKIIFTEPFHFFSGIAYEKKRKRSDHVDQGWIISLIVSGVLMVFILAVAIPMERKYIVRENGKINYKKTKIFLRWNMFDTMSLGLVIYTVICVQILNVLIINGETVENEYVQFFTNQSQAWTLVSFIYLIVRISNTLKAIKERWGDSIE
jgi:ABC-type dipeptide/oligopeptide/nickel transport system permease component